MSTLTLEKIAEFEAAEAAEIAAALAVDETPIIKPAQHARGMFAVTCPCQTKAAKIAALLCTRFNEGESAYILTPRALDLFQKIMTVIEPGPRRDVKRDKAAE